MRIIDFVKQVMPYPRDQVASYYSVGMYDEY